MAVCKKRVGKGAITWQCSVELPDGLMEHIGPCAANENQSSLVMRERWFEAKAEAEEAAKAQAVMAQTQSEPKTVSSLYTEASSIAPVPSVQTTLVGDPGDPHRLSRASDTQPTPKVTTNLSAHDQVIRDTQERKAHGTAKYGTPLAPLNGRNSAQDAYEEVLDLAAYLANLNLETNEVRGRLGEICRLVQGRGSQIEKGIEMIVDLCAELGISDD